MTLFARFHCPTPFPSDLRSLVSPGIAFRVSFKHTLAGVVGFLTTVLTFGFRPTLSTLLRFSFRRGHVGVPIFEPILRPLFEIIPEASFTLLTFIPSFLGRSLEAFGIIQKFRHFQSLQMNPSKNIFQGDPNVIIFACLNVVLCKAFYFRNQINIPIQVPVLFWKKCVEKLSYQSLQVVGLLIPRERVLFALHFVQIISLQIHILILNKEGKIMDVDKPFCRPEMVVQFLKDVVLSNLWFS